MAKVQCKETFQKKSNLFFREGCFYDTWTDGEKILTHDETGSIHIIKVKQDDPWFAKYFKIV